MQKPVKIAIKVLYNRKWTKTLIFVSFFCLLFRANVFAFSPTPDQIISLRSWALLNYTAPTRTQKPRTKQEIVDNFCKQSLSPSLNTAFSDTTDRYHASNSLFLSLLCSQSNTELPSFHPTISLKESTNYLRDETSLRKLKYSSECTDPNKKYQESCNLSFLSNEIISDVISDLTTLKQGNLYGIINNNFTDTKTLDNQISLLAEKLLNIGQHNNDQTKFCWGKLHSYPKTCNQIAKSFKAFSKAFDKLKIIDTKKLLKDSEKKHKDQTLCIKNKKNPKAFDALFCNIFSSLEKSEGLNPFINQTYNELLRYMLFSSYYRYNLSLISNPNTNTLAEIDLLNSQPLTILSATNQTLKQLSDIQSTYPYHIGLLAYQEDLLWLRNNYLSKLVTPFYTFFYKVQDVQIPN